MVEVHRAKTGYTPAQAESEFLALAKDLPRYGQHLFLATVRPLSYTALFNSCSNCVDNNNNYNVSEICLAFDKVCLRYE